MKSNIHGEYIRLTTKSMWNVWGLTKIPQCTQAAWYHTRDERGFISLRIWQRPISKILCSHPAPQLECI